MVVCGFVSSNCFSLFCFVVVVVVVVVVVIVFSNTSKGIKRIFD